LYPVVESTVRESQQNTCRTHHTTHPSFPTELKKSSVEVVLAGLVQLQSDEDSDHSDDLDLDYDVEIIAQQTAQSVTAKPAATLQAVIVGPPGAGPANNPVRTYKAPVAKANTKDIAIQKLNYNF
jgi:hypothetical protein